MKISQREALGTGVRDVIRTAWLTSLCLATLGGSLATKVVSAPGPEPVEAADRATKTRNDALLDTLTKADKFAVVYIPAEDVRPSPIASAAAQPEPINSKPGPDIVGRDRPAAVTKKVAVLLPRPRPKITLDGNGNVVDSSKAAPKMKACRHHDPIASFLVAAGIAPRCES
jgi:hypothetical protein